MPHTQGVPHASGAAKPWQRGLAALLLLIGCLVQCCGGRRVLVRFAQLVAGLAAAGAVGAIEVGGVQEESSDTDEEVRLARARARSVR